MFQIDTGQARTDLYGLNKGAAQVLDLSPLREQAAQQQKFDFLKKEKQEAEANDREADAFTQLAALNKVAVLPREQKMFADMQGELYADVKKNIRKIRAGDTAALLEVQQKIGDIYSKAELSKNTREQIEAHAKQMATTGFGKYRKKSVDYLTDFTTNPAYNGQYNFDPSQIAQKFDYNDHLMKDLFPYAKSVAGANERGYTSNFSLGQAQQTIEDDLLSDPIKMQQANDDFEEAEDKLGARDAVDFMKKKYAPKLVINSVKPTPEWMNDTDDGEKKIMVTNTIKDDGGDVHVMNKTNNEDLTIHYDADGNITGGTQGTRLTPSEKTENDKIRATNIEKEKAYHKAKREAEALKASFGALKTKAEIDEALEQYKVLYPKKEDPMYAPDPIPYQEKDIKLDKQKAMEVAHDKFGVKPTEILKGNVPKHVDVQHLDTKAKASYQIKGKSYSLADLKAMGYTEEQVAQYKSK